MEEPEAPDAVAICIDALSSALTKAEVSDEMPASHPKRPYAMPSLTGCAVNDCIIRASVAITCWDASDAGARRLATDAAFALKEASLNHPLLSAAKIVAIVRDEYAPSGYGCYEAQMKLTINQP